MLHCCLYLGEKNSTIRIYPSDTSNINSLYEDHLCSNISYIFGNDIGKIKVLIFYRKLSGSEYFNTLIVCFKNNNKKYFECLFVCFICIVLRIQYVNIHQGVSTTN